MSDAGEERPVEAGDQVPLEANRWDYIVHPSPQMVIGPDGLPVLAPGAPPAPEPGLSRDSFVCAYAPRDGARPERPACEHYGAIVMPSRGITKGMRASPREIRRFCRALAIGSQLFELTDNDVLACTLRHPMDPESERKILEVEREQRENAADAARRAGKIDI